MLFHGEMLMDAVDVERMLGDSERAASLVRRALDRFRQKGDVDSARRAEDVPALPWPAHNGASVADTGLDPSARGRPRFHTPLKSARIHHLAWALAAEVCRNRGSSERGGALSGLPRRAAEMWRKHNTGSTKD